MNGQPSYLLITFSVFFSKHKYVAYLEGDDFGVDKKALQKQVDFLEQNEDYSFCFYDAKMIDPEGSLLRKSCIPKSEKKQKNRTIADLASERVIPTLTKVWRTNLIEIFEEGVLNVLTDDVLNLRHYFSMERADLWKILCLLHIEYTMEVFLVRFLIRKRMEIKIATRMYFLNLPAIPQKELTHHCLSELYLDLS